VQKSNKEKSKIRIEKVQKDATSLTLERDIVV